MSLPAPAPDKTGATLLLVDDEQAITRMLASLLRRRAYRCVEAQAPHAALALFQARPEDYDLVITDQMMPAMTGTTLVTRLRALRANLPVILCTGYSGELLEQDIRRAGVSAILEKPIDLNGLVRAVAAALGQA